MTEHMNLLKGQEQVGQKRALPVNEANLSATATTSTSATVQLYYYSAGVRTSDAGQAAGTVVDATFVHKNILNSLGTNVATKNDTSLAYTCLALTTELEIASQPGIATLMEALDNQTPAVRAAQVGALLNAGEFIVDYRRGLLIGKKATTASTMTGVTYQYSVGSGGTGTLANQVQGNVASGSADSGNPVKVGLKVNVTSPTFTDGNRADLQGDINGYVKNREQYAAIGEDNVNGVLAYAVKPLSTSTYSWTRFQNYGANATLNIKATTGNIYSYYAYQTNAANRFEQLHNTATTPSGGAVPAHSFLVEPSKDKMIGADYFGQNGDNGSNGWAFAHSTTFGTYTAGTAADGNRVIMYK